MFSIHYWSKSIPEVIVEHDLNKSVLFWALIFKFF